MSEKQELEKLGIEQYIALNKIKEYRKGVNKVILIVLFFFIVSVSFLYLYKTNTPATIISKPTEIVKVDKSIQNNYIISDLTNLNFKYNNTIADRTFKDLKNQLLTITDSTVLNGTIFINYTYDIDASGTQTNKITINKSFLIKDIIKGSLSSIEKVQ